ncbi:hypothetical protein D3C86_1118560 [compost metagenome]
MFQFNLIIFYLQQFIHLLHRCMFTIVIKCSLPLIMYCQTMIPSLAIKPIKN